MEQLRLLLAVVLSMAVFLIWSHFYGPKPPTTPPPGETQVSDQAATAPAPGMPSSPAPTATAPEQPGAFAPEPAGLTAPPTPVIPERVITVETPLYVAQISTLGATVKQVFLKDYKQTTEPDSTDKKLVELPEGMNTLVAKFQDGSLPGMTYGSFETRQNEGDILKIEDQDRELSFTWTSPSGVTITKVYRFNPKTYVLEYLVDVHNGSPAPLTDQLSVSLSGIFDKPASATFVGPEALIGTDVEEVAVGKIHKKNRFPGSIRWAGLTTRYFLTALIPQQTQEATLLLSEADQKLVTASYLHPRSVIQPGTNQTFGHSVFFGPKEGTVLKEAGHALSRALSFGWFDIIARPCLYLMNLMYKAVPNYGLAIIALTLLIKILFWPLGNKSYRSMHQMKALQPMMQEIREKYKDDKKKMNEEMMQMYRTFKVNPMSGCLPMLVQIPVFIALYKMLYIAIELRHAPFVLWITDLSAPDRLFPAINLPFINPPGIPILTILMGLSMFLQQKMSPPPADPTQAKMMMLLPLVMTFIFINFPAGLVLYWLVNNILSMSQQYYVNKKLD